MRKEHIKKLRFTGIFLIVVLLSLIVSYRITRFMIERRQQNASYIAESIIGSMQSVATQYIITAKGVGGYIQSHNGDFKEVDRIAINYVQNIFGIENIQFAPDGVISFCTPEGLGLIGNNFFAQGLWKKSAEESRDSGMPVLIGPLNLRNSIEGFMLLNPIYIPDERGKESFWGFSCIGIDRNKFAISSDIQKLRDLGYSYQFWINDNESRTLIYDDISGLFEKPARKMFKLGGKDWSLYMEPTDGWLDSTTASQFIAASFLFALICAVIDYLVANMLETNTLLKKQAKQLRDSEENERSIRNTYEASIESAELFLWEVNLTDGSAKLMNNPYTRKISEAVGMPKEMSNLFRYIREHIIPDDYQILDDIFSRIRHGEKNLTEILHFVADGSSRIHTLKISYFIIFDEYGKPIKGCGTAQDITEDSEKRDGYNQELAFFNSYQDKDIILRTHVDLTANKVLEMVPFSSRTTSSSYDQLTSTGEGMNFIMEDGMSAGEILERNRLLRKFSMGSRLFTCEYKTGKIGSTNAWSRAIVKLLESPDTKHVEMFLYTYNISEQKNEQIFIDRIINFVYEKIGLIDLPDGYYRNFFVKNKAVTNNNGVPYDDFIRNIIALQYVPEIDRENFIQSMTLQNIQKELDIQDTFTFTSAYLENIDEDGIRKPSFKMFRFCYLDNIKSGIIVCISDVTRQNEKETLQKEKLKDALLKAESANRAKSEFVSRISHDIRTPIGAIQNLTQFAKNDIDDKEKLLHDLSQIETSNKFLLSLINDVLDISKVDKGQIRLTPEVYLYDEFVDSIENIMEPMCMKRGQHWQFIKKEGGYDGAIIIDRIRLNQIALNILSNASKYTPECGEVTYTSKSHMMDDGKFMMAFEVKDTGIGMSEEFQKHMFEEFSQEYDNSQRPKGITGTGLGLAIVKRMVDLMGGSLQVESEIGRGTTVNVQIPCGFATEKDIRDAQQKEMEEDKQNEDAKVLLNGKILLAEDNPINTEIALTILEGFDCKVDHAENGKEAVELFAFSKDGEYAVILMDIQMPFMDGYEATKNIRSLKRDDAQKIPIIAMTADAFEDAKQRAFDAGVNDYLTKPLVPKLLKKKLLEISKSRP